MMKNILVAIDGSENSKRALLETRQLAECTGANVTILNVSNDLSKYPYLMNSTYVVQTNEDLKEFGKKLIDDSLKVFEGFQGTIDTMVRSGEVAREIIEEAEGKDYDLIVMGSRGLGTFSRTMLGSVSNKVLNHVDKDVLIIR